MHKRHKSKITSLIEHFVAAVCLQKKRPNEIKEKKFKKTAAAATINCFCCCCCCITITKNVGSYHQMSLYVLRLHTHAVKQRGPSMYDVLPPLKQYFALSYLNRKYKYTTCCFVYTLNIYSMLLCTESRK